MAPSSAQSSRSSWSSKWVRLHLGGAGAYRHVSGDFPIAALCGAKKQFNSVQVLNKTTDFVLIQYNVHSLINFEERMQRVLHELEGRHWDAVAFAETWRSEW